MGRSRYAGNEVIDGRYYAMWADPSGQDPLGPDILDGVETIEHVLVGGERLDVLAHRYYGDEDYWWIIALANRISDPFMMAAGTKLRIPAEARSILDKLNR
jgi:nucleoid-associated protein YgaU